MWIGMVEGQLRNADVGKDAANIQNLIKKHQVRCSNKPCQNELVLLSL